MKSREDLQGSFFFRNLTLRKKLKLTNIKFQANATSIQNSSETPPEKINTRQFRVALLSNELGTKSFVGHGVA